MTEKTQAIVLTSIPYNDHTVLVHLLTERLGKVTCRMTAARSRRSGGTRLMLAPMTLVDLVASRPPHGDIFTVREAQVILSPYQMMDMAKSAQCVYMAELLDKSIREVETNDVLWNFVRQSLELLSLPQAGLANFHLVFTTRLSYLLGFRVDLETYSDGMMFDVSEGIFTRGPVYHPYFLPPDSAAWLYRLLRTDFGHLADLPLTRRQRNTLLDMMLTYLHIHIPEMGEVHSADVLKDVFEI